MNHAVLVLEDGRVFRGNAYGKEGTTLGELVFATGMTGYQDLVPIDHDNHIFKTDHRNAGSIAGHQDIAAGIIGYIRQAALGEALLPFEQRVAQAMQSIYTQHPWTPVQRRWLDRLAKQLTHELVIDHAFVNTAFANDGGAKQLDKLLGGQLEQVIDQLADGLWPRAA